MKCTIAHIELLVDTGERIKTDQGREVEVWKLKDEISDEVLSSWAKHFRNHYCDDNEIDYLRKGYNYSRADYLNKIKFPDNDKAPGPSIRAGDFGEILIADFLEYLRFYWVPRTRYSDKTIRNESTKGADIMGFKLIEDDKYSTDDELAIFESKTQFSGNKPKPRLQDAINGSVKDITRKAESLNAIKQRLSSRKKSTDAEKIERFQNEVDHPYKTVFGAVALFEHELIDLDIIAASDTDVHPNGDNLILIIVKGEQMMKLVHELYERAANET